MLFSSDNNLIGLRPFHPYYWPSVYLVNILYLCTCKSNVSLNIISVNLQIPPNFHATTHQSYQEPPVLSTLPMPLWNTPPPQVYTLVITPL